MCFYQPNRLPCTCSFLNLARPCSQAEFYPSIAPPFELPLASSSLPSPSPSGGDSGGVLIKPCPNQHITYEAGERYCLKCCRTRSRTMRMGMVDLSGEKDGNGFGDMDMIPLDSPDQDSSSNIDSDDCDDSGCGIGRIPPPYSPSPTLHTTRPNRFKRQQTSSPVMHLRMKWKKSLIRSVRASAAEAAAEEARVAKAKAEAEAEAARTVSIPDYMNMAMAMAMDDSKSVLAGCEIMGLGITVDGNGGVCLTDIPTASPVGRKMVSGSSGRSVNGSYRGVEFSTRVNGFS